MRDAPIATWFASNGEVEGCEMADTSREDTIHPVTFEIEQVSHAGKIKYQARVRLNGHVIVDIGKPQPSEFQALDTITLAWARRVRA
jgi:hypothetical protein